MSAQLLDERAHELVRGHRLEFRAVGEEGHELRGFFFAVVGGEGGVGFLLEDGNAFGAARRTGQDRH